MMDRSDAPAIAALVACPARSECPAYPAESSSTAQSFSADSSGSHSPCRPAATAGVSFCSVDATLARIASASVFRLRKMSMAGWSMIRCSSGNRIFKARGDCADTSWRTWLGTVISRLHGATFTRIQTPDAKRWNERGMHRVGTKMAQPGNSHRFRIGGDSCNRLNLIE